MNRKYAVINIKMYTSRTTKYLYYMLCYVSLYKVYIYHVIPNQDDSVINKYLNIYNNCNGGKLENKMHFLLNG